MPLVKNLKYLIGGPEATVGSTTGTVDSVIPIRGLPTYDRKAERQMDPVIKGDNMDANEYAVAHNVAGGIPISWRSCKAVGHILRGALTASTGYVVAQVGGCIRISSATTSLSCKISASSSAKTITSLVGTSGAEAGDTGFGTAGIINTTAAAFDTLGELAAAIQAYGDYSCVRVFGATGLSTTGVITITSAQGKSKSVYVFFTSTGSGAYAHFLPVQLTDAERKGYTVQGEGIQTRHRWFGNVINNINISAALKGMAEGDVEILGMKEGTTAPAASSEVLEASQPWIFSDGALGLEGTTYTYVRNINLQFANNHNPEGYGQGALTRAYQQKGSFAANAEVQLRMDTNADAFRADQFDTTGWVGLDAYFEGKTIAASVPEACVVTMPWCRVSNYEPVENGDVLDSRVQLKAFSPAGTLYGSPVQVVLVSNDTGRY